jgi:hypothetical protein
MPLRGNDMKKRACIDGRLIIAKTNIKQKGKKSKFPP